MSEEQEQHERLRELLGAYALGHLGESEAAMLRAHLDGCPACRAELDEITPLVERLGSVEAGQFDRPPAPPADLGERIRAAVATERGLRELDELARARAGGAARRGARARSLLVAAVAVVAIGAAGVGVGRLTAPEVPVVPLEPVAMEVAQSRPVQISEADLVAHTWGVELRITAAGFAEGEVFRAAFRGPDGELEPAGEFLGTGEQEMVCFLQSALLREDATAVVLTDSSGKRVAWARI